MRQSVAVFRSAGKEGIRFQPTSAETPYINAAYAFDYYGLKEDAIALIHELIEMRQDDIYGHEVINHCKSVLAELQ